MVGMFLQFPARQLAWQAQEVVRVVDRKPHLMVRITLTGGHFQERALVPFVRLVEGERIMAQAWFTEITEDGKLSAYFAVDLPLTGILEYGYFPEVLGRVPLRFDAKQVQKLDRKRLHEAVVETTTEYLEKKGFKQ